ncbi:hypothetical protein OYE22_19055 [Streptomyces sp. 71268]|uniref:hypothetical protein n=1 Tax=Streptomyces sp. 71268 TaxID=3002640 RepID=UPI0023F7A808|nr:hypothetical protein [Streptomyces sp. 71268]WEV27059.1 hypothetical protein OYE22_19055 [Streptomyces sp. 71268]
MTSIAASAVAILALTLTGCGGGSSSTGGGGQPSGVQGVWYHTASKAVGKLITVNISGTSVHMSPPGGKSCSGTIKADNSMRMNCGGDSTTGKAEVTGGGENPACHWSDGSTDRFQRTKPAM